MSALPHYRALVIGEIGAGKSALCRTITGNDSFISKNTPNHVTLFHQKATINHAAQYILDFIDSVGLIGNFEIDRKNINNALASEQNFNLIFTVFKSGKVTPQSANILRILKEDILGQHSTKNIVFVITNCDQTELIQEEKQIEWLNNARTNNSIDSYFKQFLASVNGRILFVSNPNKSPIEPIENANILIRAQSKTKILNFIKEYAPQTLNNLYSVSYARTHQATVIAAQERVKKEKEERERRVREEAVRKAAEEERKKHQARLEELEKERLLQEWRQDQMRSVRSTSNYRRTHRMIR
jgi:predicted GTPase